MTEVTPHPVKTQGFHHFFILLFYDHPAKGQPLFCGILTESVVYYAGMLHMECEE